MDQSVIRQLLSELRFSSQLTDDTATKLAGLVSCVEFQAGETVFEEGADHPWLYLIVEGEVGLEMCVPARRCMRILTLGPGDLLAWSSLLGDGRMTAGAQAVTNTRMLIAPAEAIKSLCATDHEFGYEIVRGVAIALSKRLVATRLQLLDLYGDSSATASDFADRA